VAPLGLKADQRWHQTAALKGRSSTEGEKRTRNGRALRPDSEATCPLSDFTVRFWTPGPAGCYVAMCGRCVR